MENKIKVQQLEKCLDYIIHVYTETKPKHVETKTIESFVCNV